MSTVNEQATVTPEHVDPFVVNEELPTKKERTIYIENSFNAKKMVIALVCITAAFFGALYMYGFLSRSFNLRTPYFDPAFFGSAVNVLTSDDVDANSIYIDDLTIDDLLTESN